MDRPKGAPSFGFRFDMQPPQPVFSTSGTTRKMGSDGKICNDPPSFLQPMSLPPRPADVTAPSNAMPQMKSAQKNQHISTPARDPKTAGPASARPKLRPTTRRRILSAKIDKAPSPATHTLSDSQIGQSGSLFLDYDDPKTPVPSFEESSFVQKETSTDSYKTQSSRQHSPCPTSSENNNKARRARGSRGGRGRKRGEQRELYDSFRPTNVTGKRARADHYSPTRHSRKSRSPSRKRSRYCNTQHEPTARPHEGRFENDVVHNNVHALPEKPPPPVNTSLPGEELAMNTILSLTHVLDVRPPAQMIQNSDTERRTPPWKVIKSQSTTTERHKPKLCKKLSVADMAPGKIVYLKKDDRYSWTAHPVLIVGWIRNDRHIPVMGITSWNGLSDIREKWGEGVRESWKAQAFRSRYMLIKHGDDATHDGMPIINLKDNREMVQKSYLDLHHIRAVKVNRMEKFMPGWNPCEVELADPLRTLDTIMERRYAYLLGGQHVYSHF